MIRHRRIHSGLGAVLVVSALSANPVFCDEIRAEKSETTDAAGVTERVYRGAVSALLQNSRIMSDSALVRTGSTIYRFYSNARFENGDFVVSADHLQFNTATQSATLEGHVHLADGKRTIRADRVVWQADAQTVEASGRVKTTPGEADVSITADRWFSNSASDSSAGSGNVHYQSKSMSIRSNQVTHVQSALTRFSEDVSITAGMWGALAAVAEVRDRKLTLSQSPSASRSDSDSTQFDVSGNTIEMTFTDTTVSVTQVTGDVRIRTQRLRDKIPATSTIVADSSRITENGDVANLEAYGSVSITLDRPGVSVSKVLGDAAQILFLKTNPERIGIPGFGSLEHERLDGEVDAVVKGDSMTIDLGGSSLKRIQVDSNAVADLDGNQPIKLSGDRLVLGFRHGKLTQADVNGSVRGQYWPQDGEAKKQ